MFNAKYQNDEGVLLKIPITDDNVFCICPGCGKEVGVNIVELAKDKDFDLYATQCYCPECSGRIIKKGETDQ